MSETSVVTASNSVPQISSFSELVRGFGGVALSGMQASFAKRFATQETLAAAPVLDTKKAGALARTRRGGGNTWLYVGIAAAVAVVLFFVFKKK